MQVNNVIQAWMDGKQDGREPMKILLNAPYFPALLGHIDWPGELTRDRKEAEAWIVEPECPVTKKDLVEMVNLQVVITASTGDNHIDKEACEKMGVEVFSLLDNRSALDEIKASSEMTFLLILNALRRLDRCVQFKYWLRDEEYMRGRELYQKMVGLVGHGRIGKNIENWCRAFGAGVYWTDPYEKSGLYQPTLYWLFSSCLVIVICCTLTEETKGLITKELMASMRQDACLINTARGEIIDEEALIEVAQKRPDLTFCLDVLSGEPEGKQIDSPLLDMENVVCTPHISGLCYESNHKAAQICCQLLKEYIGEKKQ